MTDIVVALFVAEEPAQGHGGLKGGVDAGSPPEAKAFSSVAARDERVFGGVAVAGVGGETQKTVHGRRNGR